MMSKLMGIRSALNSESNRAMQRLQLISEYASSSDRAANKWLPSRSQQSGSGGDDYEQDNGKERSGDGVPSKRRR